jgi:uncharacterized membrane protein YsdA (DUF1294 family)
MKQPVAQKGPNTLGALRAPFPLWLKAGFWICIVIAVAVVLRRAVALLTPSSSSTAPPQLASLDAWFATRAPLTWTHILCALAFVTLLPFVFRKNAFRPVAFQSDGPNSRPLHRAFFLLGAATGVTAYAMSLYAVGGWLERSAVLFFNTAFLASLAAAYAFMRRHNHAQQQRWTIRAVAILLGIATTRPVMGVFFATAPLSHLTPHQFFGIAFWIGFSLNTLVIELWLRTATASPAASPAPERIPS